MSRKNCSSVVAILSTSLEDAVAVPLSETLRVEQEVKDAFEERLSGRSGNHVG